MRNLKISEYISEFVYKAL